MSENGTAKPILVVNATGKTGSRVAARLRDADVPVRAASRNAPARFDWHDPTTWPAVLEGASAAYISYFPDLTIPGAPEAIEALAKLAVEKDVDRLVLLSARGQDEALRAEELVRASGADTTIVRSSWFMQNFSEAFLREVAAGEVSLPVGAVGEPFVDVEDVADVAVAALTEDGHSGETYEVTGPRLLTFAEAVAEIGDASGREVVYNEITMDEFVGAQEAEGVPADEIALERFLFGELLDGRNESLTDGVERALGREPRDFAAFARDAAGSGVWAPLAA